MKKLVIIVIVAIFVLSMIVIGYTDSNQYKEIITSMEETKYNNLYYDTSTKIVYLIPSYDSITAYYAENGLPYKYNPVTGELECINN